jgi:hypothetical protein
VSPLPGWKVIPDGFAEHHTDTVNSTMTEQGTIYRVTAGPPPFPKPEGWSNRVALHVTDFRVQELKREGGATPGEQPTRERQYMLTAPLGLPKLQTGERGDIIAVAGREFRVQQVLFGSLLWEIDIICTDNLTQQNPV